MTAFAEPVAATNYSFLRGASHPAEMVARAAALGMTGIGIADRNTVAGVVRALVAWRDIGGAASGFRLIVGARLVFADGTPDIVAYPRTRRGWGQLTRLLTLGNRRTTKGECELELADLLAHCEDLALIAMDGDVDLLRQLRQATSHLWLAVSMSRSGKDARDLAQRQALAEEAGVPLIATGDALYAAADARPLHDVLTCIREGTTIRNAGRLLEANAERHLKPPAEMARLFRACPEALAATQDLFACIDFTLDELQYEYPHEPVPEGWDPQDWLEHLVMEAAKRRFPEGIPKKYRTVMKHEFRLIRKREYAYYFLTVHDVVHYARSLDKPILCQGRGSAANSLVCYFLGITPIDPVEQKLLFSRFLSENRNEPPDIDVDFEHERREEVIQYIYRRYTRDRAGIAATVIHYRQRSVIREVGKVLGMSEDVTSRLSGTVWGSWGGSEMPENRLAEAGFEPGNPELERLRDMVGRLLEFPRHLSQHVGGFVLCEGRLDELVPIHNAAMPDRTFIEWDKNDIDALGLMKVDVLALGMLTAIRKSFDLMRDHGLGDYSLDNVPHEDATEDREEGPVYKMLQKGDSIGAFQVESRAQISMLPRMRPKRLYDLVIQVAIVRPGPIQGGMVHPYLRRRTGEEKPEFPSPGPSYDPNELKEVLGRTLGVPLFQEQAMKLAITAAAFTPAEADGLRRAMATFRNPGTIKNYEEMLTQGMIARGYPPDFAERCFKQIRGFGEYGFPESHAQAFAWLAYVSSWLKCHYPAVFTCALLNSQPMGFYAPAQLVRDAQEHGVEVRGIDVNASTWDNTLEDEQQESPSRWPTAAFGSGEGLGWGLSAKRSVCGKPPPPAPPLKGRGDIALRLGLRQIGGFRKDWAEKLEEVRKEGPFTSMEDLATRSGLPLRGLQLLADADALGSTGQGRRLAGWEVRRLPPVQLPLFTAADAPELGKEPDAGLPPMPLSEEVVADYQTHRLSLKGHPMQFLRRQFAAKGVLSCAEINAAKDGARVRAAGVVLVRQRPGTGKAIFITIEDETGIVNALLWASEFEKQRRPVMASRLAVIEGEVQRSKEDVVHLMASRVHDASAMLSRLAEGGPSTPGPVRMDGDAHPPRHGHPRNVRILPRSRDFH